MREWLKKLSDLLRIEFDGAAGIPDAPSLRSLRYWRTAKYAHECGHAVLAWLSTAVFSVEGISFRSRGHVDATAYFSVNQSHPDYLTESAVISLGGLAGEALVWRKVRSYSFGGDLPIALEALKTFLKASNVDALRRRWEGRLAESSLDVAAMLRRRPPPDVAAALNLCYRRAKWLLTENRAGFDRLVALAMEKGDLSRDDIASQFGPRLWARQ